MLAFSFTANAVKARGSLARNASVCRSTRGSHARRHARQGATDVRMIRGFPNEFNNNPNAEGNQRLISELVDFPCVFQFKVVGSNEGDFMKDIVDSVSGCVSVNPDQVKVSFRDRGRYRSISLNVPVNTADQVYSIYAAIDRDPRVKFKF